MEAMGLNIDIAVMIIGNLGEVIIIGIAKLNVVSLIIIQSCNGLVIHFFTGVMMMMIIWETVLSFLGLQVD